MLYLDTPPKRIDTTLFTQMPEEFRRPGIRSDWADANKGGHPVDCFLEGPAFDAEGNLFVVDIPFGRVFRISPAGAWALVCEYEGWPNGLKIAPDGRILIADYRRGLLELDPDTGKMTSLLAHRNSESFRGCNDLCIASNGDIYFTDQGQTGLHDPTGRVYRREPNGRLTCLISNGPSPNGLVLSPDEKTLFVAMTRDNSVWRAPLLADGSVSKVGRFCHIFGTSGPDGLAMTSDGCLVLAHASLGAAFVYAPNGECRAILRSVAGKTCTNIALASDNRVFITESETGSVLVAALP